WNRMVREEISKGHPLLYSAVGEQGWHAFVVDGFSDDLFHVNWGWDGYLDGYYSFQPLAQDHKSDFINMQWMVAVRDDDPSADIITYGTTINGINYELMDDFTAVVLPLKDGNKYRGDLVIPSHVDFEGNTYTVNYFGPNAFVNCEHLESISIPATITGQEWSIFDGCENLHKVNVEDMAAFIRLDVGAWWTGSPLTYGGDLYLKGELVKDLVIPEGIEYVGYCKFRNCWSIESITMSSTMKNAGQYSFANCPKLKRIDMSQSSMEVLGTMAFVNSESLEEITIPATVKTMEYKTIGQENGPGCEKLRKIVSLATTPPWCTDDDIFAELQHSDAILYVPDAAVAEYQQAKEWCKILDIRPISEEKPLPETTTVIDGYFIFEINLTENYATIIGKHEYDYSGTDIPASVSYNGEAYPVLGIGYQAVCDMNLNVINANLRKIGIKSFINTSFVDRLEIPASLTYIPRESFLHSIIPHLVLPKDLISIGKQAFGHREHWDLIDDEWTNIGYEKSISSIEIMNPYPPMICEDTFDPVIYAETYLLVPFGCKKAYASAPGWRNFINIINIGEEQEQIHTTDLTLSANRSDDTPIRDRMPLKINATIRNSGSDAISRFKLSWQIDGKPLGEKHYDMELQPSEIISLDEKIIARVESSGKHELKLIISADSVEDQDTSDNEVIIPFESFDKGYYRVSLFEQFTTESCSLTTHFAPQIANGIQISGQSDFLAQVTHHCGFFDDFLTLNHDYEWFYNEGGGSYTPAIMLNRTDIDENGYTPVFSVPNDLDRRIIKQSRICDALVSVDCNVEEDNIIVKTLLEKNKDFDLEAGFDHLTVFLLEDSIPSREQLDAWSDGFAEDYIHRNTVRKVLSGIWGDKIVWDGDVCAIKYKSDIDPEWNKDNLKAVAFIHRYNPESPIDCQVYTANSSDLPQYGRDVDDNQYREPVHFVDKITLNPDFRYVGVGETFEIEVTILPETLADTELTWTSSNEDVAIVNAEGKVTAVGEGEASIIATASDGSGVNGYCTVIANIVEPESISINPEAYSVTVGDSFILSASVWPENTTNKTVIWSSDNENIAVVDPDGTGATVTALAPGYAEIYATASNGLTATCHVNVEARYIDVTEVLLDQNELNLTEGDTATLIATVNPEDATDKMLTWASSDSSVATVDGNGTVTAIAPGSAEITVIAANGIAAYCIVRVEKRFIDVRGIYLSQDNIDMTEGDSVTITATIDPADATDQTIIWSSSDENIAVVDPDGTGATVTALAPGYVEIYATAYNGIAATCYVNVEARYIDVTDIFLDPTELSLTEGETAMLTATVQPADATDKTVTWTSSDESVASVDADGTVTAISIGEATITATCGNVYATCIVTVNPILAESLTISPEEWEGEEGSSFNISATILPENTTDKSLSWESSDVNVATVENDGTVNIIKEGTCIITVSTLDGSDLKAECRITGLSGVDQLFSDPDSRVDVYSINGILLKLNCSREEIEELQHAIYILRLSSGNTTVFINR
ncbi:MAG: Ig-like domain-containing protein, partial [Muribaculaceae bacterium]|nr:Ig-like domain-containing protein [Muribaculaceae bacterium]